MFRVLVLDDEAERHRAFADVLEGCEVQHVLTASEAKVALIEEDIFDLVCLDHDLGATSRRSNTGMAVAEFITRDMRDKIPGHVLIHSNNVVAAERMQAELASSDRCLDMGISRYAYSAKLLERLPGWVRELTRNRDRRRSGSR
jgi:CheY-like chemotaxis protein